MEKLYRIIAKAAHSTHPVLILGENGTGKELVARSIHFSGPFRDKPFIPVDCGSLVPTLIESELFGYVKGAFTGAVHAKEGLLAIAEGGTVFLDEVGELPVDLQAKLLRAIQEKEIRPVGSTKRIPINVRILAATNRDLEQAVSQGIFRRDLYFRLNVLSLRIPSLRERRQDIPILAAHFLERLSRSCGQERTLSDDALKAMLAYDWPGNVRELENCLERACAFTTGPMLHLGDLPAAVSNLQASGSTASRNGTKIMPMAELEKQTILNTIAQLNGDKLLAARLLCIGKTTLYRKLKEYSSQELSVASRPFPVTGARKDIALCKPIVFSHAIVVLDLHNEGHDPSHNAFGPQSGMRASNTSGHRAANPCGLHLARSRKSAEGARVPGRDH